MKHIIDIETWERKENFNFFRHFLNPQLSITSEVVNVEEQRSVPKKLSSLSFSITFMLYSAQPMRFPNYVTALTRKVM